MSETGIEQRLANLELQMKELLVRFGRTPRQKDWRRTVGMFAGDPGMRCIFDEAVRLREEDRQRFYAEFDREQSKP